MWKGRPLRRAYTHKALNALIQGASADLTKKAMLDLYTDLNVVPHSFDLAMETVDPDYFSWNLNLQAIPVDGDGIGDIVKLGLSDIALDEIKDREDTQDIPVLTLSDNYIDLFVGLQYYQSNFSKVVILLNLHLHRILE